MCSPCFQHPGSDAAAADYLDVAGLARSRRGALEARLGCIPPLMPRLPSTNSLTIPGEFLGGSSRCPLEYGDPIHLHKPSNCW